MRFIIKWIIFAVALYLTFWSGAKFGLDMEPGLTWQENAIMALVLGLVNAIIVPILRLMTLPLNCLTFGIAGVILNALLFWFVFKMPDVLNLQVGFRVGNFWAALYGSVVLGIINGFLSSILLSDNKHKRRD